MLRDLIFITMFGLTWGILILVAYKAGYKDGKEVGKLETREISGLTQSSKSCKKPVSKPVISEATRKERQRVSAILENIDNYDGTGAGQKEV